jgi:HPr kinase/phosphorylase
LIIHGVALSIYDLGVLLLGASLTGKSELALSMLDRGHHLIADDAVQLKKGNSTIYLQQVEQTKGLLHLRNIGIIKVAEHFGEDKTKDQQHLDLIVALSSSKHPSPTSISPQYEKVDFHNCVIHQATINTNNRANLALMLETLVKQYKLTRIKTKEKTCLENL